MRTQSQKNSEEIIKLQGEVKLIHTKIMVIKDNHLAHIDKKLDNLYKIIWLIFGISLASLADLIKHLLIN
jgi:hypothetical protein